MQKIILKNKNWLHFLFFVKVAALKQQMSKFYLQILSTAASFYIYNRQLTEIHVMASFCVQFADNIIKTKRQRTSEELGETGKKDFRP